MFTCVAIFFNLQHCNCVLKCLCYPELNRFFIQFEDDNGDNTVSMDYDYQLDHTLSGCVSDDSADHNIASESENSFGEDNTDTNDDVFGNILIQQ